MVLTNAGMIPQSVRADVPDGTEITVEVNVNTASMNSKARSCRIFLGKGGGFVALIKARPSSSPVSSPSPLLSTFVSSWPSVPRLTSSWSKNEFSAANENRIKVGNSPKYCPFPTPSSDSTFACLAAILNDPAGESRLATSAVRASIASARTSYGTWGESASARIGLLLSLSEEDEADTPPSEDVAAPLLLTVGRTKSTNSPHNSGCAMK
mmetsp:Transcript_34506/g.70585  ORF Transcript_34506/g.70585 Transcript_34506/m.70585 type:complete len:210 (-) Transcript_34506:1354-1983(-)